jgi:prepilin-type processing-associated H-X9-DG protein
MFRTPDRWCDLPSDRHGQAGNLSFADGHVERWKWAAPKLFRQIGQPPSSAADMKDFRRIQAAVRPETRFR